MHFLTVTNLRLLHFSSTVVVDYLHDIYSRPTIVFSIKTYVVGTQKIRINETVL